MWVSVPRVGRVPWQRCCPRLLVVFLLSATTSFAAETIVDLHVHTAGIGAGGSGAFVNREMRESWRFGIYLSAFGVSLEEIEAHGDALLIGRISERIGRSERIDRAVVLAMDGVVDRHGELDREATQVYVPNDFVAAETAHYDNLLFGASVNPYRPDALERLERARDQGAALVKWLPNIMHIDPGDEAIAPFYRRMAELGLPLLSHAGQERSFASARDEFGDPDRLRLPLETGVTVIAAHIAARGRTDGAGNFDRLVAMFERYPNLYADVSSLTQVNRLGYLKRALGIPGVAERLVYGSDWPLQFFPLVSPWYHLRHIGFERARSLSRIDNAWDRDVGLKEALGLPRSVLRRSATLLPDAGAR